MPFPFFFGPFCPFNPPWPFSIREVRCLFCFFLTAVKLPLLLSFPPFSPTSHKFVVLFSSADFLLEQGVLSPYIHLNPLFPPFRFFSPVWFFSFLGRFYPFPFTRIPPSESPVAPTMSDHSLFFTFLPHSLGFATKPIRPKFPSSPPLPHIHSTYLPTLQHGTMKFVGTARLCPKCSHLFSTLFFPLTCTISFTV